MKLFLASVLLLGSVYAAPTEDYRSLYDHLLVEDLNGKINASEETFMRLNQEVNQFLHSKNEELRQRIVNEIEFTKITLKGAEQRLETELKKTGLNAIEKFILKKTLDESQLLILSLNGIENTVNKYTPNDQKEIEKREAQVKIAEQKAQAILKEIHDYNLNSTPAKKAQIIAQIDAELEVLKMLSKFVEEDLIKFISHGPERLRIEKLLTLVRRIETSLTEEEDKIKA